MPLGTPLPPPLPLPPPPRPSRLSWPGPRCLPRTIVPSTAAGGGRGAGRGTQEALRGAGRGCGVRRPGGLAGTMNQAPQTHSPRSSSPGRQESPFCRAAAAAFLGMARPGRRSGRAGGEAGSCPSFLPFFEVKIPSSRWGGGARAAARAGSAVSLLGSAAHVGFGRRDPARQHFPATAAGAGASPASGSRETARRRPWGRGCGRCWRDRADWVGREPHGWRTAAGRPPRPAALPASRLTERGPAPGRHALRPRAPRGPPLAVGASPCPASPRRGPAAAQLSRDPGPCASDALRACPRRPGQLRRSPRRCGHPPGPRLLPFLSTSNFRASPRN